MEGDLWITGRLMAPWGSKTSGVHCTLMVMSVALIVVVGLGAGRLLPGRPELAGCGRLAMTWGSPTNIDALPWNPMGAASNGGIGSQFGRPGPPPVQFSSRTDREEPQPLPSLEGVGSSS